MMGCNSRGGRCAHTAANPSLSPQRPPDPRGALDMMEYVVTHAQKWPNHTMNNQVEEKIKKEWEKKKPMYATNLLYTCLVYSPRRLCQRCHGKHHLFLRFFLSSGVEFFGLVLKKNCFWFLICLCSLQKIYSSVYFFIFIFFKKKKIFCQVRGVRFLAPLHPISF